MSDSNLLQSKKVWLITGASRGLGRALAEAVLGSGDELIATARNPDQLQDLKKLYGNRIGIFPLDITDATAVEKVVEAGIDIFGRLDIVVNNAGFGNIGAIEDTSLEEFRSVIETNLFGVINMTKAVIPFLREQHSGHIINISSVGGRIGSTGRASYSAAKFGVEGFSEVLATEMAPVGVRVTLIEPGGFRTDFAGSSTKIHEVRPAYDSTVGKAARFQRDYDGKQPGDPKKAAQVILQVAAMEKPPLRLLLGSDAVRYVREAEEMKIKEDKKWEELSQSTDFEQ
jgi:NAD(P)-dependent dehydrogenase (short-subunit alcohol dehydrogenase family)